MKKCILVKMRHSITFYLLYTGFAIAQFSNPFTTIEPFLNQSPNTIVICNMALDDQAYFNTFLMSLNYAGWIDLWNCIDSEIPKVHGSLMMLNDIDSIDLKTIFSKRGVQNSISHNIWVIHIRNVLQDPFSLFDKVTLKIGLNAQIFIMQSSDSRKNLIQVLGTGTNQVEFKEIEPANIANVVKEVAARKDFKGVPFTANFATDYFPYSFLNKDGNINGIFYDVMNIAANHLNVSLKYQEPQAQNFGIWLKK